MAKKKKKKHPAWKPVDDKQLIYLIIFITIINLATDELTGGFSQDLHNLSKRNNKQAAIIHINPLSLSKASTDPLLLSSRTADTSGNVQINCTNITNRQ